MKTLEIKPGKEFLTDRNNVINVIRRCPEGWEVTYSGETNIFKINKAGCSLTSTERIVSRLICIDHRISITLSSGRTYTGMAGIYVDGINLRRRENFKSAEQEILKAHSEDQDWLKEKLFQVIGRDPVSLGSLPKVLRMTRFKIWC